ncbi:peptidase C45 [Saccharopolyspora subtropica]|uniref:C45 family autoproteolytic acyltransferase/hydolase n=1 Tax=Saccharopolyspora thermophila TaxID=89367 RepID=A0A917JU39_9PSEU|nr:C45 family peptidase [Saccharopolyspora subtropica]GGI84900.1 peptidase C45 [Saccharopolyspora subtropica]
MRDLTIPFVELRGSARERGRQHGEFARGQIGSALAFYADAIGTATGLCWPQVTERVAGLLEPCRRFAPDLVEEMTGIAEGAGVELTDILALNARGELVRDRLPADEDLDSDGCSSFALLAEATGDGHVYCGQNWDWRCGISDTIVVVRIVQPPKPTVLMHLEAGQVGRQGANSAGLALNANGLGGRFVTTRGLPQPLIRRKVLDAATVYEALDVLSRADQQIASNALLTHRDGFAIDVETTPGAHGWMYPEGGILVHGNHYQAFVPPQLAADYRPRPVDSLYRVPRISAALRRAREATTSEAVRQVIREAFADHFGYPAAVCTHPDERVAEVRRWSTVLHNCIDLTTGEYRVTAGNPCTEEYQLLPWNLHDGPGAPATG